jgi:hypothetical protein
MVVSTLTISIFGRLLERLPTFSSYSAFDRTLAFGTVTFDRTLLIPPTSSINTRIHSPPNGKHRTQQPLHFFFGKRILKIQGLGLLSSILQDKLRTLESKRESVLQELEKTLNEINITKMQLGKAISEEERQIHLQAVKSIQNFLDLI